MVVTGRTGRSPLSELRGAVILLGIAKMILYPAMLIQVANASEDPVFHSVSDFPGESEIS